MADPDTPVDPSRITKGRVIQNMIYHHRSPGSVEVFTGWKDIAGTRVVDQETVPPFDAFLTKEHPCFDANTTLGLCSVNRPEEERLAARTSACNAERVALMKCLTKHKVFDREYKARRQEQMMEEANRPWWKLW